jgi:hypothetical protein
VGAPYAGCAAAFTGASDTNPSNSGLQTVLVDPAPGNVSPLGLHSLIYGGWSGKAKCEVQLWFYPGSPGHITSPGMDQTQQDTANAQVAKMISRQCDAAVLDWYGPSGAAGQLTAASKIFTAAAGTSLQVAVMEDEGAVTPACPKNQGGVTQDAVVTCISNAINSDMDYIRTNYAGLSSYLLSGSNPEVYFFLTLAAWTNPALDAAHQSTIWHNVQTHTNGFATPFKLIFEQGDFSTSPDGAAIANGMFAWPQPYGYTAAKQLCWDIKCAGITNFSYVGNFYSEFIVQSGQIGDGLSEPGFDDNIGTFGHNRVSARRCGQTWLDSVNAFNSALNSSGKTADWMIATWNDYEEGTEIETGIDNCFTVSQAIAGGNLTPTLTKTDATYATIATIDHLRILYTTASGPCTAYCLAQDNLPPTTTSVSLNPILPAGVPVTVYTQAVGVAGILNQISSGTAFTAIGATISSPRGFFD